MEIKDSIIIGGGPAGMTAALYLLRAGKSVLLLEKESIGGQVAESPRLENFPSIKAISGSEFSDNLFAQISDLGAEFELESVVSIKKENDIFTVKTDYGEHLAKTVILATGCKHRKLGLAREDELTGKGVSYCAVCDGAFYKNEDVVLIGDANSALQYAVSLSEICKSVAIVTLFDHFFADDILVRKIKTLPNVTYFHNFEAKEFLGEQSLTGVRFINTVTKEERVFSCSGCFVAIGQLPCNEPFANLVDLNKGFIQTNENMETKTPGLFAAGDCREKKMRQVVTATSDAAIAAISAAAYLNR